jgi:FMN phosphatase YigB (HAD superfamily)
MKLKMKHIKKTPNLLDLYNLIKEDTKPKYIIFCDLDGVLVDFDKGYQKLTGKPTHHADVQVKKEFWKTFNDSIKTQNTSEFKYWSELEWMSDGKQLWNYIKSYNPYILTAPTYNPESKEGKTVWVNTNLTNFKKLYFKSAATKSEYSHKNRILIDDRAATIDEWNAKGGIGILHTNALNTIKQLKQLGL